MVDSDVTVCGAGISGLLIAAELSKSHSVTVLERGAEGQHSAKFWLTSREALDANPEYSHCVDSHWDEMDFISNARGTYTAKGQYVLWNTKRLEAHLIDTIVKNGSRIWYEHRFYSYERRDANIVSHANNSSFTSSVVIDCMGFSSPIVASSTAARIMGYHHLLGRTMQLSRPVRPIAADNVLLQGRSPSFLEVFPKSDGTANVVLIAPSSGVETLTALRADFEFIVNQTHYSRILRPTSNADPLYGVVPVGVMKKRALDRVFFYGEAGQTHPAASCTCLTRLLLSHKELAVDLSGLLASDKLSSKDLRKILPRKSSFSQRFNQNLFRQLNERTSEDGRAFVELLGCLDDASVDDLLFGEISPRHFLNATSWRRIVEKRNTAWLKPLARTIFNL